MSRKAWQFSIVVAWGLFVTIYVWIVHVEPPHDGEYTKWLFASLFGTTLPWALCSIPVVLIVLSLEDRFRLRRMLITIAWALIVVCVAWVDIHRILHSSSLPDPAWYKPIWHIDDAVGYVALQRLFPALFVLAASLWIEKKLVARGVWT